MEKNQNSVQLTFSNPQFQYESVDSPSSISTNSVNPLTPKPNPPPVSDEFIHTQNPNRSLKPLTEISTAELRHDDTGQVTVSAPRGKLPDELSRNVVVLTCESTAQCGSCDVYLIGTNHLSKVSAKQVQDVIRFLKPEVVFLELGSLWKGALNSQSQKLEVQTVGDMINRWKTKRNLFGTLFSEIQAKTGEKLNVRWGSEFYVASEEAKAYGGKVILGDRPIDITVQRTWVKMPLWHKIKMGCYLLCARVCLSLLDSKTLKEMVDDEMSTPVNQEMSEEPTWFDKAFPTTMETLLDERDRYMSSKLLEVASEHSSVVAVVGKGHLPGIKKLWKQPVELREILEMPAQKEGFSAVKIITSIGVAVIISGIYFRFKK